MIKRHGCLWRRSRIDGESPPPAAVWINPPPPAERFETAVFPMERTTRITRRTVRIRTSRDPVNQAAQVGAFDSYMSVTRRAEPLEHALEDLVTRHPVSAQLFLPPGP